MDSGNSMVNSLDRYLDSQEWRCEACGSRREPEEARYCMVYGEECISPCPDVIETYREEIGLLRRAWCRVVVWFGGDPYRHLAHGCPESVSALVCENCGHLTTEGA